MKIIEHYIVVGITAVVLTVFCGLTLSPHEVRCLSSEQRLSNPFPTISPDMHDFHEFTTGFEAYLNDSMPLRTSLLFMRNITRMRLFGVADSRRVIVGKNGWLYLSGTNVAYFRNDFPFTAEDLENWSTALLNRQRFLADRRIPYLLVVAPSKCTVYPENFPARYNKVRPDSRLDQLCTKLVQIEGLSVLDIRQSLSAARSENSSPLYYKKDTHWNDLGALVAARSILPAVKLLLPGFPQMRIPEADFMTGNHAGDLATMLNLEEQLIEQSLSAKVRNPRSRVVMDKSMTDKVESDGACRCLITRSSDSSLPKVLVLRDSFTIALQPFLSECFSEATYCWQHDLKSSMIENRKPDLVVEVLCERFLMDPVPKNESRAGN